MEINTENPEFRAKLIAAQGQHLSFLEGLLSRPALSADLVPIMQAFTYDLIQVFNHVLLKSLLSPDEKAVTGEKVESK